MPKNPLPRLNKYGLAAPSADDVRGAVAAVDYGRSKENWRDICDRAGIGYHANLLDLAEMHSLADALIATGGSIGIIGTGFRVRVSSYELLSSTDQTYDHATDLGRKTFEGLIRTRVPEPTMLSAIHSLDVTSENNKFKLDSAAQGISRALGTPIGLITVIMNSSQYVAGNYGLTDFVDQGGTPLEWAFCATTVRRDNEYIVEDADKDVIQRANPLTQFHNVKAYAGVPLRTSDGTVIGACCVLDTQPHEFSPNDVKMLKEASASLTADLEDNRSDLL